MSVDKPERLEVEIGESGRTFQGGNFINAIDEVVSFFEMQRDSHPRDMAELMQVYALKMIAKADSEELS